MFPNRTEPWGGLAEYHFTLKNYNLAKRYYQKSLGIWTGNTHAMEMLERIAELEVEQ
jgi:hypothetical protein